MGEGGGIAELLVAMTTAKPCREAAANVGAVFNSPPPLPGALMVGKARTRSGRRVFNLLRGQLEKASVLIAGHIWQLRLMVFSEVLG